MRGGYRQGLLPLVGVLAHQDGERREGAGGGIFVVAPLFPEQGVSDKMSGKEPERNRLPRSDVEGSSAAYREPGKRVPRGIRDNTLALTTEEGRKEPLLSASLSCLSHRVLLLALSPQLNVQADSSAMQGLYILCRLVF